MTKYLAFEKDRANRTTLAVYYDKPRINKNNRIHSENGQGIEVEKVIEIHKDQEHLSLDELAEIYAKKEN